MQYDRVRSGRSSPLKVGPRSQARYDDRRDVGIATPRVANALLSIDMFLLGENRPLFHMAISCRYGGRAHQSLVQMEESPEREQVAHREHRDAHEPPKERARW